MRQIISFKSIGFDEENNRKKFDVVIHDSVNDKEVAEEICQKIAKENSIKCFVIFNREKVYLADFSKKELK